ncbi:hypothetical protein Ccrd_013061 [Cynara cardunculus var. scolymus]|uniref:Uncharacterized protein n=1 Tax=Cynara cardunculus var. scolymus TaxID=59895 RepID=A0A103YG93_CYNCS|nr:hypothetical protein Ccrd_013061 [Cynara cardunculus var. scolymus]
MSCQRLDTGSERKLAAKVSRRYSAGSNGSSLANTHLERNGDGTAEREPLTPHSLIKKGSRSV